MGRTNNEISATQVARFKDTTFQIALLLDTRSVFAFTVNTGTDVVTATAHDYVNGTIVNVSVSGGGSLPDPLVASTNYYVRDIATNTFKLALTQDGTAIDITTAGTGTFSVTDIALTSKMATADFPAPTVYVRKELTDYEGLTIRPTITFTSFPADFVDTLTYLRTLQSISLDNTGGAGDLVFDSLLLIRGGTTAIGNTTGACADFSRLLSTKTILAGQADTLQAQILSRTGL